MNKKIRVQAWRAQQLLGLLLLLATSAISQTMDETFVQRYGSNVQISYQQAKKLIAQRKYSEAIHTFSLLRHHHFPIQSPYWTWLMRAYVAHGDYDSARHICTRLIAHDSTQHLYYFWIGQIYFYEFNYAQAIPFLKKAKELTTEKNDLLEGFIVYADKGRQKALPYLDSYIATHPNDSIGYLLRSYLYGTLSNGAKALADCTPLYTRDPTNSLFYVGQSFALLSNGKFTDILTLIKPYADKNITIARYVRARVYLFLNQIKGALSDFYCFNKRFPGNSRAHVNMGAAYVYLHQYDSALYYLNLVKNEKAQDIYLLTLAHLYETGIYCDRGEFDKALKILASLEEKIEVKASVYQTYRDIYLKTHQADLADEYHIKFARSKTLNKTDSIGGALVVAAKAIMKKDWENGARLLDQAEAMYHNQTQKTVNDIAKYEMILHWRGYFYFLQEKYADAIQYFDQSLLITPNQKGTQDLLAECKKRKIELAKQNQAPPAIAIHNPVVRGFDNAVQLASGSHVIRGTIHHPAGVSRLMINNTEVPVESSGFFQYPVDIKKGLNMFSLVAISHSGSLTSKNMLLEGIEKIKEAEEKLEVPNYHAILIAESKYMDPHAQPLIGPPADMRKMYHVLTNRYVFNSQNVDTLVDAPRLKILETLIKHANAMGEKENLLIFYAGHGTMVKNPDNSEDGYLVPSDAEMSNIFSMISREDLTHCFKYSKAKHILFIADACFSGTLFRSTPMDDAPSMSVINAYKDKSRRLLASGNRTVVYDESDFVENFRLQLQENKEKYVTAEMLVSRFKQQYENQSGLSVQYYPMKDTGDFGGHFVFVQQ